MIEAARAWNIGPAPDHVAGDVSFDRPAIDADRIVEAGAGEHIVAGERIAAGDAARLADAELRRNIDDVRIGEARRTRFQKREERERLAAAFALARAQFARVGAVDGAAIAGFQLCDVHPPFALVLHRPHNRALARKAHAAFLGHLHQSRDGLPGFAGRVRIDAVEAEHHGRKKHIAVGIAEFERRAGEARQIAVA
jgi:hypothetical protein